MTQDEYELLRIAVTFAANGNQNISIAQEDELYTLLERLGDLVTDTVETPSYPKLQWSAPDATPQSARTGCDDRDLCVAYIEVEYGCFVGWCDRIGHAGERPHRSRCC